VARIEIGKYLAVDTRICGGRLILRGTRILVADVVSLSERGYAPEEIAEQYHGIITPAAVKEALTWVRRGRVREVKSRAGTAA
jgi:uncharacterized protein (DUF433 family)